MKTVSIWTQRAYHFCRKYTGFFNQAITGSLSLSLCVAGRPPVPKPAQQGRRKLSCKENNQSLAPNSSLCDPPHPPGLRSLGPGLVPAGSRDPGLSATTLLNGNLPGFSSARQAWVRKKFCSKFDTFFINPDIYRCP